ncbi:MAG: protein translocase subunit SecD [Puniceicoccales bacterium]|jgi:SecD/SecF fusion protein|nr:protein translocase subunit SecD [Puniceicoccales bacterium]
MSSKIFWKLFASALFLAYAIYQLIPLQTTPFDQYIQDRATARQAEFKEILAQAEKRVAAYNDPAVPEDKKSQTMYNALRDIGMGKGESGRNVDLSQFFTDMHLVKEQNIERKNGFVLQELLQQSQGKLKLGLDLQGGVSFTLRIDPKNFEAKEEGLSEQEKKDARAVAKDTEERLKEGLGRAITVMEGRINAYGVAEPQIRPIGNDSIEIQLPGQDIANNPDAINALKKPAKLEFRMVHRYLDPDPDMPEHKIVALREDPRDTASPIINYEVLYLRRENHETGVVEEIPLYVKRQAEAAGNIVRKAAGVRYEGHPWQTSIIFTAAGSKKFEELTGKIAEKNNAEKNGNGRLAIVLDGKLVQAPGLKIDEATGTYRAIAGGEASIDASNQKDAVDLANVLNNPLEFPLELQDSKQIGASLAADAQTKSIHAAAWGVGLVVIFMVLYYLWAGVISVVGLIVNVVLMLGIMAAFGATITLPGVAALVLTTGMAVDANILIFERIREELAEGKALKTAVHMGYDRAQATIIDVHLTSLMTAIILIVMGNGPVKGFGIILAIGIVTTVFTSLITCRALQEFCVDNGILSRIFGLHLFKGNTKIQFMNYAKPAFIISWIIVAISIGSLVHKGKDAFSKDFKGGEAVVVRVAQGKQLDTGDIVSAARAAGVEDVTPTYQTAMGGDKEITLRIETELSTNKQLPDYTQATKAFQAVREKYPDYFVDGSLDQVIVARESIGGTVSGSLQKNAIWSVALALLGIAVYVGLRFEAGFGLGAMVSSLHDVLLTVGLYVLCGHQFSAAMIAAILMVVGYSINDTIVVFDRIREEMKRHPGMNLRDVIHLSINRTLSRTVLTALTVFFNAVALYVFGAGDVREYGLVFIFGVVTGTFSSIFIASPVFYWWHRGKRESVERAEAQVTYSWEAGSEKTKAPAK